MQKEKTEQWYAEEEDRLMICRRRWNNDIREKTAKGKRLTWRYSLARFRSHGDGGCGQTDHKYGACRHRHCYDQQTHSCSCRRCRCSGYLPMFSGQVSRRSQVFKAHDLQLGVQGTRFEVRALKHAAQHHKTLDNDCMYKGTHPSL